MNRFRFVTFVSLCATALALASEIKASQSNSWQIPAWTPMSQVQLHGTYATRFERACKRLHLPPLDDCGYVLADISLDRKRIFTQYSGDISGRTIGVEAFLAANSKTDADVLRQLLDAAPTFQKADGHFGALQKLPELNRATDMPILWGNGRLLIGLVEAYEATGDTKVLATAKRLGDYFVATDAIYCKPENLQSVGGRHADAFATCYFSCIEGLVGLARVTGETRYRHEAERIADLALGETFFDNLHSHGRLCAVRGFVDLYELTGDQKWLAGAQRDWRIVMEKYRLPTSGITEMFSRSDGRDEGCAVADWLRLNLGLWRVTGQGAYLDEAERCLKNHFAYQQFAAGGAGHRPFTSVDGEPFGFAGPGVDAYWCCCEHWPRAMVDVARLTATIASDGISVNLYVDAESRVSGAGAEWEVRTAETADELQIEVAPQKKVSATLHIHKPAWADGAQLQARRTFQVTEKPDEWIVRGAWSGRERVSVRLPETVRIEKTAGGNSLFVTGHVILVAHAVPANSWYFQSETKTPPTVCWKKAVKTQAGWRVPATLSGAGQTWNWLELAPMRQFEGSYLHRCCFAFVVDDTANPTVSSSAQPQNAFITATATFPCKVFLNGREIGQSEGWKSPVARFEAVHRKNNTLLILCDSNTDPKTSSAVIAAIGGSHGYLAETDWKVKALTAEQAKQSAEIIAGAKGWEKASKLPGSLIPSRENRASLLEDIPPNWATGKTEPGWPVLAFKLIW